MKQIQVENRTTPETIKPSTPTPHHLRRHDLSFFDVLEFPKYMNTIVYFSSSSDTSKITRSHVSNTLKTSLAEILSIYYPLAGRMADNDPYVDCRDQGAHYREANVKGSLNNEILSDLDPSEMLKFLPYDMEDKSAEGAIPLLLVQVNFFECGGLVIGLLMYHRVADGASLFTFLKNWASVARKGVHDITTLPDFGAAKLFPPVDLTGVVTLKEKEEEDIVSRRFVFSNDTILGLCKKYSTSGSSRPSRVEALTAFIWKRFIASTQDVVVQPNKTYRVLLAANLRPRFNPPLKPSAFGNMAEMIAAIDTCPNEDNQCKLVKNIRALKSSLSDPENTKLYRDAEQLVPKIKETVEWLFSSENDEWVFFSSFIRLYEIRDADFGWGPPSAMHVYVPKMLGRNCVIFMDANDGNGIDAWTSFSKEDMAKFEVDPELLAHAC